MPAHSNRRTSNFSEFIRYLRRSLPYLEEFHNETFVIKISGDTLLQNNLPSILDDLVLLHRIGVKIIVVHGAHKQILELLEYHQKEVQYYDGRLLVTEELLPIVKQAVADANWNLMTKLGRHGNSIFPFSGHFIQAQKLSFPDFENHFIGEVGEINSHALLHATNQHYLPIIPPFAPGPHRGLFILDASQIALEVAVYLRARKLIMLSTENSFLNLAIRPEETTTEAIKQWLQTQSTIDSETEHQVRALVEACQRGVERCHLLDSTVDGALLGEILTPSGAGIMITNSPYERIRRGRLSDLPMIMEILVKPLRDLSVVHKDYNYLEGNISNFMVFCVDEELVGCCELIAFEENQSMELASLAVKEGYRNRGIGKQLITAAIRQAKQQKRKLLFALTMQATHVFLSSGFKEIHPDKLPQKKRENYDFHESLIYGKFLV